MKQEVGKIDARLIANAGSPGATANEVAGGPRLQPHDWKSGSTPDRGLIRGEGTLDYDIRAFHLSPDGVPRVFVRARWKLANAPVFLVSAWFKAEEPQAKPSTKDASGTKMPMTEIPPVLLSASDSSWSSVLREAAVTGALGDSLKLPEHPQ